MRVQVEVDDALITQAIRVTGLKTKKAVVNEALRRLVCRAQAEAIEALEGLGWEGDLKALRKNRDLLEDLDDIDVGLERIKNPGPRLTMEEAKKALGLDS